MTEIIAIIVIIINMAVLISQKEIRQNILLITLCIICSISNVFVGGGIGERQKLREMQKMLVESKHAEYIIIDSTGKTEFQLKEINKTIP